ncbi:probable LRR receptor-like serine/threonine-protein kinase At3g47570 [Rhodamnia argentea]|uniref:Probable LRR receptor-like serine/threonine-protein kinase At3g47570 n=1 Tax=Rhodamnia argentea TaxID=178133 RepID=A0ABM3HEB3_9MYRT|nr:probable LRR receptor-like serine/threonine-protein kinase At3g47570 [Rhodamnia argentea]
MEQEYLSLMVANSLLMVANSLETLQNLTYLNLSNNKLSEVGNNLSGGIPRFLEAFDWEYANLSFNNFEGSPPTERVFKNASATFVIGNEMLCGGIPEFHLPKCISKNSKSKRQGILVNGTVVAVKVLNSIRRDAFKSFMAECEALKQIRHCNLFKIISVCSSIDYYGNDFKALVYEFMVNGSLEEWLHHHQEPTEADGPSKIFSLLRRIKIAIDIASALDYLHNHCHSQIIHCDLKPSNVLLDDEMDGHVVDFGLAKDTPDTNSRISSAGLRGAVMLLQGRENYAGHSGDNTVQECLVMVYGIGIGCSVGVRRERISITEAETNFMQLVYKDRIDGFCIFQP